jgi:hypothetical protein
VTMRQVGEAGIKLLGVYFAASAVHGIAGILAFFVGPQLEGFPSAGHLAAANSLPVLANLVVASVCLFGGESVARKFFADEQLAVTGLSRRDLLVTGVSLLGLSIALAGVPGILQTGAIALWYAEGSRQPLFLTTMQRSWDTLVNSGLALLVGSITAASAVWIASALDARYSGASKPGEPAR